jgi:transcriptional regulator with XRE-family HTH domain
MKKQKTFLEILEQKRWDRSLIAKELGITYNTVYAWTNGNGYPTVKAIITVSKVLEITPAEVLNSLIEQKRQLGTTSL